MRGVALKIRSKQPLVVEEAKEAVPAHDFTEKIEYDKSDKEYTCYSDDKTIQCSKLKYYDELKKEVDKKRDE